jgi:small conductance mechanosensitive channel
MQAFLDHLLTPQTFFERVASTVLVIILSLIAWLIVIALTKRAENVIRRRMQECDAYQHKRYQRALTGVSLLANILKWAITLSAFLAALICLGLGPKLIPVLAGAGVVGLAIGFGAQFLVRDLIAGLIVLIEGQYGVGDFVQIGGVSGQVMSVGLRVTVVRDLTGRVHFLPNGSIAVVAVYDDPWTEYLVDVLLESAEQAERAVGLLTESARLLAEEHPQVFRIRGVAQTFRVGTCASVRLPVATFAEHDWLAKEELVARLNAILAREGVKLVEGRPLRVYPDLTRLPLPPSRVGETKEGE